MPPATITTHPATTISGSNTTIPSTTTGTVTNTGTHHHHPHALTIDPVTGQPSPSGVQKPCCHSVNTTNNKSINENNGTDTTIKAIGGALLIARIGYGLYRYYQYNQHQQQSYNNNNNSSS